jgi:hypothetical protein
MYLNGKKIHSRINRIVSLNVAQKDGATFFYTMEMFRRSQVTNYMRQAEKDFWNNLAYIYDRVQYLTDYGGQALQLLNVEEIQKKQADTIDELAREYKGQAANQVINQIEAAGSDATLLSKQLREYKLYGLFFGGLYEQVRNHLRKRKLLDIFGSKDLILEERFLQQKPFLEDRDDYLNFNVEGQIVDYCAGDWLSEAEYLGLKTEEEQQPIFNFYKGEVSINTATSIMEKAEINLSLSYGTDYKREQFYSLLLMNEEDIEDLF